MFNVNNGKRVVRHIYASKSLFFVLFPLFICLPLFMISKGFAADSGQISQLAQQEGVKKCLPVVNSFESYLFNGDDYTPLTTYSKSNPNKHIFKALVVTKYSDGNSITALTIVPNDHNTCDESWPGKFRQGHK